MAKKGLFKKILKGALTVGGAILGVGAVGGVVKGIRSGTGVLAGLKGGIGGIRNTVDKLKEGSVRVLTGTTKKEREQILAVKKESREAQDKLQQVQRLINAGATPEEARATVGVSDVELTSFEGEQIQVSGFDALPKNKKYLLIGAGLIGVYLLAKFFKIIR